MNSSHVFLDTKPELVTFDTWFMFEVERLTNHELYITPLINKLTQFENHAFVFEKVSQAMFNTLYSLDNRNEDDLYYTLFNTYCFKLYTLQCSSNEASLKEKEVHLATLLYCLQYFYSVLEKEAFFTLQNFFMELNSLMFR